MNWTKEKPTKPGRYALKEFGKEDRMRLCEVFTIAGAMYVTTPDNTLFKITVHDHLPDEWYGPLDEND